LAVAAEQAEQAEQAQLLLGTTLLLPSSSRHCEKEKKNCDHPMILAVFLREKN